MQDTAGVVHPKAISASAVQWAHSSLSRISGERGTDPVIALEAASKWIEDGVEGAIVVEGLREIAAALLGGWY